MYCSHFGLHRPPFNNTPDPSFYYSTPDHEEALATLQYATTNRKGFVLVTGEVGAGKTLIGRMFIRQIERQASTAVITHTQLNARQLLAAICSEFELDVPADATNLQLADRLQEYLLEQFARDRFVVVLLDEGQNLPDDSFEALRMLGNLEADDAKLLQVCILGQPELRDRFKKDSMRQLEQRLFRRFHLRALNAQQSAEYIQRRLAVAGCTRADLFSPAALACVYAGSSGIPRVINQICDNVLLAAYAQGHNTVDAALVSQVLEQEGLTAPAGIAEAARGDAQMKDAVVEAAVPETGFVSAPPTAEQTEARLEQIYGTAPELVETEVQACGAPRTAAALARAIEPALALREHGDSGLPEKPDHSDPRGTYPFRDVVSGAAQQWPAVRQMIDEHRHVIQQAIDEVTARCREAAQQVETVAMTAAPAADLEELRQLHVSETQRVLDEIARSRTGIEEMVGQTESRLMDTQKQLRSLRASAISRETLEIIEQQQEKRIQEAQIRFDQYRRHIDDLVHILRSQCDQTQGSISGLVESCARMRAELADRVDDKLAEFDRHLQEQLQSADSTGRIDALREAQTRTRLELTGQFESRLAELHERIQRQIATAAAQEAEAVRADQARELERIRRTSATATELQELRQTMVKPADVDAIRHASVQAASSMKVELQEQLSQTREDFQSRLGHTLERLTALREAYQTHEVELKREVKEQINSTAAHLGEQIVDTSRQIQAASTSSAQQIEAVRAAAEQARSNLARELTETQANVDRKLQQAEVHQQGLLAEHKAVIDDLARSAVRCDAELKTLAQDAESRWESIQASLGQVKTGAATVADLRHLREQHDVAVAELSGRLDASSNELADLSTAMRTLMARASKQQAAGLQSLADRLEQQSAQVQDLRVQVDRTRASLQDQMDALQQECASRTEVEQLHQAQQACAAAMGGELESHGRELNALKHEQAAQAQQIAEDIRADRHEIEDLRQMQAAESAKVAEEIQTSRRDMQNLIDALADRFAIAQQMVDALEHSCRIEHKELGEFRQTHVEDLASLFRQLEDQRQATQARFDQVVGDWTKTQEMLDALRATAADADALEEVRRLQDRQAGQMRQAVAQQRQELEAAIRGVDRRCDEIIARVDALPADIATAEDVRAVQEENAANKAAVEAAIQAVTEQCDLTAAALSGLADRTASREQVARLEEDQSRHIEAVVARLESQEGDCRQEFEALNQRWAGLREELHELARSSTSVEKFEAAERLITEDLNALKQQLENVTERRQKDVRILVDTSQRLMQRVQTLEQMERPESVKLELQPQTAHALGQMNKVAEQHLSELRNLLAATGTIGDQLRASSAQIEHVMSEWLANADHVQQQSAQLRQSAEQSSGVLQALRKCNQMIDAKLKSNRWQNALRAGDQVAARLEQATAVAARTLGEFQQNLAATLEHTTHVARAQLEQAAAQARRTADHVQSDLSAKSEQVTLAARNAVAQIQDAISNYESIRGECDSWAEHREEVQQVSNQLARLIAEAKKAEGRLDHMTSRVGSLAHGIAEKTAGLAELLGAAREFDEQERPTGTPANARKSSPAVSPVTWPKYRTHPARVG